MSSESLLKSYSWITREFLEAILSRETTFPISINQFTVQPAIQEGENYSSQLIRVHIDFQEKVDRPTKCKSLIIKASLGERLVRSRNVFAKEIDIFTQFIPCIEQTFCEHGIDIDIGPKYCIFVQLLSTLFFVFVFFINILFEQMLR